MTDFSSQALKRAFVKDFSLPVPVLDEPYFSTMLERLDPYYGTKEKARSYLAAYESFGEDEFHNLFHKAKKQIVDKIRELPAYARLDREEIRADFPREISTDTIYQQSSLGKYIISLDLVSANFQSFSHYDKSLVLDCETYDEFILSFDDINPYIASSKKLRQLIFGELMPKKQQSLQLKMMAVLAREIVAAIDVSQCELRRAGTDELLLICDRKEGFDEAGEIVAKIVAKNPFIICQTGFVLNDIFRQKPSKGGSRVAPFPGHFAKNKLDGTFIEFKGVPAHHMAQAIAAYEGRYVVQKDLAFMFEKQLAFFDTALSETYIARSKEEFFPDDKF